MTPIDLPPISQLPWAVGHDRFVAAAKAITGEGACCLFVIDEAIPASARSICGRSALRIGATEMPSCPNTSSVMPCRTFIGNSGSVSTRRSEWL